MSERIQKVLARLGYGSRREIESWIREGRIRINDKTATIGDQITRDDRVDVDGRPVKLSRLDRIRRRVILYNKNEGEICSRHDPEHADSVFDHLPVLTNGRWIAIGRLDLNTCGLLLFTNDGELANRLMHPSFEIEREYAVRVLGEVPQQAVTAMLEGVETEDGLLKFDQIRDVGGQGVNHWYHVILHQGRYREVRRLWESQGIRVSRLKRIRYGPVKLPRTLRQGSWIELTAEQVRELLALTGLQDDSESTASHRQRPKSASKHSPRKKHQRKSRH